MSIPYNPFELFNLPILKDLLRRNKYFLVVQRLNWPGVPAYKGFMVTPYEEKKTAKQHAEKLLPKEGRLIDLHVELEKITGLIDDPKYLVFFYTFRDPDWASRVLKHYQKNIALFFKESTTITIIDRTDIELAFQDGKLKAIIESNGPVTEFDAYDLIKQN